MKESKFNFLPMRKKRKIVEDLYIRLNKPGNLVIPGFAMNYLGIEKGKGIFISLFEDIEKRTIGFKLLHNWTGQKSESIRLIKPTNNPRVQFMSISIQSFLKRVDNKQLNVKLPLNKYKDSLMGELYYCTIPKNYKQLNETNENKKEKDMQTL